MFLPGEFLGVFKSEEMEVVENWTVALFMKVGDDDSGSDNNDDGVEDQYNFLTWEDESDSLFDFWRDKIILSSAVCNGKWTPSMYFYGLIHKL